MVVVWGSLRSTWPYLLTFLCAAERASPWALGVSATAYVSDPRRSPPGAARARSGCRWWSGCTGSWRAPSGRPRRTKRPRDWCSSGRWDAGPSDSLWSQSDEEEEVVRRGRAEPGGEQDEGALGRLSRVQQHSESGSSLRLQRTSSPGATMEASRSPLWVDTMRISPRWKVDDARLATLFVCSVFASSPLGLLFARFSAFPPQNATWTPETNKKETPKQGNVSGKTPWPLTDATASLRKHTKNVH